MSMMCTKTRSTIFVKSNYISQVHKKLGNTHLALMNFSWAMDLDPKGINNQIKEAIDKRYVTEEDDSLVHFNETGKVANNTSILSSHYF